MGFAEASKVEEEIDSGTLTGKKYPIACNAWFTSTGTPTPLSFRFEGDDGEMQTVRRQDLKVHYSEDKNYSGVPSKEFRCTVMLSGVSIPVKLVFYCESCSWAMFVPCE